MEAQRAKLECGFDKLFGRNVPHILEKIFFNLDYTSFKQCMVVSSAWHELLKSDSYKRLGKVTFNEDIGRNLYHAFLKGNEFEFRRILRSGMVDLDGFNGNLKFSPLEYATRRGWKDVVKYLLEEGVDVNKRLGQIGRTALHEAAMKGHYDVAKLLIAGGANVNVQGNMIKMTPLHVASFHTHVVKLLLDAGADVNVTNNFGRTPLYFALRNNNTETIDILRKHGGTT